MFYLAIILFIEKPLFIFFVLKTCASIYGIFVQFIFSLNLCGGVFFGCGLDGRK